MILTTATKEDVKYFLEETWDVDSDDPFCKIVARETKKGVISCSVTLKQNFRNSPPDITIALSMNV